MFGCIFPNADVDMMEDYKMSAVWLSLEKEESPVDTYMTDVCGFHVKNIPPGSIPDICQERQERRECKIFG